MASAAAPVADAGNPAKPDTDVSTAPEKSSSGKLPRAASTKVAENNRPPSGKDKTAKPQGKNEAAETPVAKPDSTKAAAQNDEQCVGLNLFADAMFHISAQKLTEN